MKTSAKISLLLVFVLCASPKLAPQAHPPKPVPSPASSAPGTQGTFTLHANVNLVVLHVTVTDKQGRRAENLDRNDFRVYEDGVPQTLSVFSHADIPVTMGIIIDDSGSMRPARPAVDAAAWTFVQTSNPADQVFVVTFNQAYEFDLPGAFAANPVQLRSALDRIGSRGGTALYDAVYASLDHLELGNRDKKALLVISDGNDNSSAHTLSQLVRREEESDAQVYTIGLLDGPDTAAGNRRDIKVLAAIAKAAGGKAFFPQATGQVDAVCRRVAHLIRDQYTLGYYPSNKARDGTFRRVNVLALQPGTHEPLTVRTRPGYYAPGASNLANHVTSPPTHGLGSD